MAKVLVTIEDNLLKRIDRTVRDRGLTRSAYLAELARRDLDAQLGPGADPAVHAALDRLQTLFADAEYATGEDVVSLVRRARDERLDRFL
jgi:DNA-binding phage protein